MGLVLIHALHLDVGEVIICAFGTWKVTVIFLSFHINTVIFYNLTWLKMLLGVTITGWMLDVCLWISVLKWCHKLLIGSWAIIFTSGICSWLYETKLTLARSNWYDTPRGILSILFLVHISLDWIWVSSASASIWILALVFTPVWSISATEPFNLLQANITKWNLFVDSIHFFLDNFGMCDGWYLCVWSLYLGKLIVYEYILFLNLFIILFLPSDSSIVKGLPLQLNLVIRDALSSTVEISRVAFKLDFVEVDTALHSWWIHIYNLSITLYQICILSKWLWCLLLILLGLAWPLVCIEVDNIRIYTSY